MEKTQIFTKSMMQKYGKKAIMAIQHVFAMMGATIIVPIITGLNPSVALISAGLGTIVFYFITKKKVPVFLGSSFAFVSGIISVFMYGAENGWTQEQTLGKLAIAIMLAGMVYFIFSAITYFVGVEKIRNLFPPVVVGPVILVIGMTLAPTVISSYIVSATASIGWKAWAIALTTAGIIIGVSIFAKGIWKVLPILFGIVGGYILSICLGVVDFTPVADAHWIIFEPAAFTEAFGFYKYLSFDLTIILMIVPISIVTFMEHMGDITTNGSVVGKDFFVDPGLHRTLMGDGAATLLAGFLGAPPNTTYGENTGVLALTKNYDPKILVLAAGFSIFLGLFSKFGGVLASVPSPVIGGASMILFGMISAMGLKVLIDNNVSLTHTRNLMIIAMILVIGLGFSAGGVVVKIGDVQISALAICTVVGIVLNAVLPKHNTFLNDKDTDLEEDAKTEEAKTEEVVAEVSQPMAGTAESGSDN